MCQQQLLAAASSPLGANCTIFMTRRDSMPPQSVSDDDHQCEEDWGSGLPRAAQREPEKRRNWEWDFYLTTKPRGWAKYKCTTNTKKGNDTKQKTRKIVVTNCDAFVSHDKQRVLLMPFNWEAAYLHVLMASVLIWLVVITLKVRFHIAEVLAWVLPIVVEAATKLLSRRLSTSE